MPTKAKAPKAQSGKAAAAKDDTGGRKPNALQQPLRPSAELAAVVGPDPLPRGEVVSKVWAYIKRTTCRTREPPRDPGRREARADLRREEGDHVRDEQAPGPAPEVTRDHEP
jgi:chromatin remodeling complex protein RSC6